MPDDTPTPPIVFISYSHDSREHKQWVAQLATALREKHVEVIFDQWDLEPGDDVPKFMEKAVKMANRVLMVCTEPYIRKANDGKGGAGYETMIVTGELVRDLGTRKFIPIIRQGSEETVTPDCVSTRMWVDFRKDEEFENGLSSLVETLHKARHLTKPQLGPNPFASLRAPNEENRTRQASASSDLSEVLNDALAAYRLAESIIAASDTTAWRKLLKTLGRQAATNLISWRNADSTVPSSSSNGPLAFHEHAEKGISFYMPLIACLVAGAESGDKEFAGQLGWIDEILTPLGWEYSTQSYWRNFPELILFVGQALVGGMLMSSNSGDLAYEMAITRLPEDHRSDKPKPLFLNKKITGWPASMASRCTFAWGFLERIIQSNDWMKETYGSELETKAAISSYYQLLSFMNFCHVSINNLFETLENDSITVPLNFCQESEEALKRGYRIFLRQGNTITELITANDLVDPVKFRTHWKLWLKDCGKWITNVFQWNTHFDIPQISLPDDLESKGKSFKGL